MVILILPLWKVLPYRQTCCEILISNSQLVMISGCTGCQPARLLLTLMAINPHMYLSGVLQEPSKSALLAGILLY